MCFLDYVQLRRRNTTVIIQLRITYNYVDVILCQRLGVPKLELILKVPKLLIPITYQLKASGIYFQSKQGMLIKSSVMIDSYQVPRSLRHGPGPQLLLIALNISCRNDLVLLNKI